MAVASMARVEPPRVWTIRRSLRLAEPLRSSLAMAVASMARVEPPRVWTIRRSLRLAEPLRSSLAMAVASIVLVEFVTFIRYPAALERATAVVAQGTSTAQTVIAPLPGVVEPPPTPPERHARTDEIRTQPDRTQQPRTRQTPSESVTAGRPSPRPAETSRAVQPPRSVVPGTTRRSARPTSGQEARKDPFTADAELTPLPLVEHSTVRLPAYVPPESLVPLRANRVPSPFPSPRGTRTSLELVIDERGAVVSARVTSSGAEHYDAPLLATARLWRFKPALVDGRPTRTVHSVDVHLP